MFSKPISVINYYYILVHWQGKPVCTGHRRCIFEVTANGLRQSPCMQYPSSSMTGFVINHLPTFCKCPEATPQCLASSLGCSPASRQLSPLCSDPWTFLVGVAHSPTWVEALEGGLASIPEAELVEAEEAARAGGGRWGPSVESWDGQRGRWIWRQGSLPQGGKCKPFSAPNDSWAKYALVLFPWVQWYCPYRSRNRYILSTTLRSAGWINEYFLVVCQIWNWVL